MNQLHLLLISTAISFMACQQKQVTTSTELTIDYVAEKKAIMQVLQAESEAFWNKDFDGYAAQWIHAPHVRTMGYWPGGITVVEGWNDRAERTRAHMIKSPEANPNATRVRREKVNLRIDEDMAWMTFDQYGEDTGDPTMDMPGLSHETRIFEKQDGKWKIAYVGWLLKGE